MSDLSMILGRVYYAATTFTVGGVLKTFTAGQYYPYGYSGETQLLETVQALIREVTTPSDYSTSTVSLSLSTGKVTIDFSPVGTGTLTWGAGTAIRDALGFTGDLSGGSSYTATNGLKAAWLPSRAMTSFPGDKDELWLPTNNTRTVESSSGQVFTVVGPGGPDKASLQWRWLPKKDAITYGSNTVYALEDLWDDVMTKGQLMRVIPDRDSYTASTLKTAVVDTESDKLGKLSSYCSKSIRKLDVFYDVNLRLVEHA